MSILRRVQSNQHSQVPHMRPAADIAYIGTGKPQRSYRTYRIKSNKTETNQKIGAFSSHLHLHLHFQLHLSSSEVGPSYHVHGTCRGRSKIHHSHTLVHTCTLACLEYDGGTYSTYIRTLLLLLCSKEERFKVHTCITLHYMRGSYLHYIT